MPKGVRHGEKRHVVHSLSLEKGLSEIHRLIRSISCVRETSCSSSPSGNQDGRGGGCFHNEALGAASSSSAVFLLCFRVSKKNNWWVKKRKNIYIYIYIFKTKQLKAGFETFSKTETFSLWQMRKKHLNFQFRSFHLLLFIASTRDNV